ncbi:MAG: phenylalanine--tRNA ligase subunit beta [Planctomycetales bacterium]
MIVSWNWLKEYVRLDMPAETLAERLMMAGLNLEQISEVEGDIAIDLEVTSNRPDCLCHLGIAREVGVLFDRETKVPPGNPVESGPPIETLTAVNLQSTELCPQYHARLIRGVRVAPSPPWMRRRLTTLGIRPINNVVDITNYVLMECSQPLHAFDFDKLAEGRIVVRRGAPGEKITAIDQREYELNSEMCVIADATRPVAIAGVMGGLATEISDTTTSVLIETAEFLPLAVRNTARRLHLFSDSSYRFERGIDRENLDWASRRCAQLILELAGGELCRGSIVAGSATRQPRAPVVLRLSQLPRMLGIEIPRSEVERILRALGLAPVAGRAPETVECTSPHWRRDLTREIDLIEEVARVHGYERIPEDVPVPLEVSQTTPQDRLALRLSDVLIGAGFCEAVTLSFVSEELFDLFRPWSDAPPLRVEHSSRQRENILRQSLIPSLLQCRRQNERHQALHANLFEIARIYLAPDPERPEAQPRVLGLVSGQSFAEMKGIVELLLGAAQPGARLLARPANLAPCLPGRSCELLVGTQRLGWLGELSESARGTLDLANPVTVVELDLGVLQSIAEIAPKYRPFPEYPPIERDLNFVLDENISWQELEEVIRAAAGPLLEKVTFADQYRGQQIPAQKKSYLAHLQYRSPERTLTSDEVDAAQQTVLAACGAQLNATLR